MMTKQVLFIHGGGGGAYEADAALAESLRANLGAAYAVRYPEMPDDAEPDYQTWKRIIFDQARDMGEGVILVGHSIGASVLIKALTEPEPKPPIAAVFLVTAPFWHDHEIWHWDDVALSADAADHYPHGAPLFLYYGEADETVPLEHAAMYANALPQAHVRRLPGRDHQLNEDMKEVARDIASLT
jgi:predicted alpha/beta hydrolase family esterase